MTVRLFGTPWTAARQASLSITNSQSLLKLMFIALVRLLQQMAKQGRGNPPQKPLPSSRGCDVGPAALLSSPAR